MSSMTRKDWYAVLQLPPDAPADQIAQAVEKRSRQAAALANTNPERSQQLREEARAIKADLLSGEAARAAYDASRGAQQDPATATGAAAGPYQAAPYPPAQYPPAQGYGTPAPPQGWNAEAAPARGNRFLRFMQSGYTCPQCSESYLPGAKYCTQCCTPLVANPSYTPTTTPVTNPNACPYCGTVAALTHRFCRNCGASRPTA